MNTVGRQFNLSEIVKHVGVNLAGILKDQKPSVYKALCSVQHYANHNTYLDSKSLQDRFIANMLTSKPYRE